MENDKARWWKKTTPGKIKYSWRKDSIKEGEKILVERSQLGNHADQFVLLDEKGEVEKVEVKKPSTLTPASEEPNQKGYIAKHKGAGRYSVFDSSGKEINESSLTKHEADELAANLNADS